ncbi:predicted protein [Sclerotinia sclerotiorum 1980 UF-70]|uniref:Uncharacterized protein n=1 Tax=Sclerotinia sclerotiorum (strain ATCC 18683 / 1980 / Ss-1) TaxID=665079 RepID=A7F5V2_SCLS1|nr:predicted protein [Sclerotinia sclerotiorum 1980 UF-70]EDN98123.1 predicted protein [Sclerotinia sclerotiorum 1980 UF-70]
MWLRRMPVVIGVGNTQRNATRKLAEDSWEGISLELEKGCEGERSLYSVRNFVRNFEENLP